MKQFDLTISRIIRQPNNIVTFEFQTHETIGFKAGQFITLEFDTPYKKLRRSYSLHNSPLLAEPMAISVKRVENGEVSRLMQDDLKVGDTLTAFEPMGQFVFEPQQKPRTLFLIGAGSGITPLFSILKTALLAEPQSKIVLIYSNQSTQHTLFYNELLALQQQYPTQLVIEFLFSNSKYLQRARLNRDILEQWVNQHVQHAKADALFYTCGPADYMLMCRIVLLGMGFEAEQIKKETFVLPEDEADDDDETLHLEEPKDTNTYTVLLTYKQQSYTLKVPYNQTILDTALQHNIYLPYSCQAGMCSTCAGLCTQGKTRMRYNEVLTDREVANGKVLLCTAHPMENDVVIEVG
jgi:ring-1,2-phenylacetyl-CoA epoxidase subunit PaaE